MGAVALAEQELERRFRDRLSRAAPSASPKKSPKKRKSPTNSLDDSEPLWLENYPVGSIMTSGKSKDYRVIEQTPMEITIQTGNGPPRKFCDEDKFMTFLDHN